MVTVMLCWPSVCLALLQLAAERELLQYVSQNIQEQWIEADSLPVSSYIMHLLAGKNSFYLWLLIVL